MKLRTKSTQETLDHDFRKQHQNIKPWCLSGTGESELANVTFLAEIAAKAEAHFPICTFLYAHLPRKTEQQQQQLFLLLHRL